ncbi:MAG TPA: ribosome silencing factor [Candidatus Acidoferrales bacterium]|nr:ribosome silencing factor [Candidatus Acidoferrales bacterium]
MRCAVEAAQNKKAANVTLLDLTGLGAFTNHFLLCTGFSARQVSSISEEIEAQLEKNGWKLQHREGRGESEWVLLDYGSFLVHIFTERTRGYYDLERLWRSAKRIVFPDVDAALSEFRDEAAQA